MIAAAGVDALVADIHAYADYYCAMALGKEPDKDLAPAFQDLRELKVEVAFPFLLELFDDYAQGQLRKEDFVRAVRLVEAYVFRRAVCAIPTNSLNQDLRHLRTCAPEGPLHREHPGVLPSLYRPTDAFRSTGSSSAGCPRATSITSGVGATGCAVWKTMAVRSACRWTSTPSSTSCRRTRTSRQRGVRHSDRSGSGCRRPGCHTLGNLTLTGYNAEYSDRKFGDKRDMQGGFKESPLRLNECLGALDTWNEGAIKMRAKRLAEQAMQVWAAPALSPEVLETHRPKVERLPGYTLDDHLNLAADSPMRPLFETFRKEVLALDSCVSEEMLKLYVAYKAETNFVDVVPQKSRLRLFAQPALPRAARSQRLGQGRDEHRPMGQRRRGGWPEQAGRTALRDGPRASSLREADG